MIEWAFTIAPTGWGKIINASITICRILKVFHLSFHAHT